MSDIGHFGVFVCGSVVLVYTVHKVIKVHPGGTRSTGNVMYPVYLVKSQFRILSFGQPPLLAPSQILIQ